MSYKQSKSSRPTPPERVIKRDGSVVPYDKEKSKHAVFRCLARQCGATEEDAGRVAGKVADQVEHLLCGKTDPTVEEIQDLVEQQLMAVGRYDAARSYILYREERKRVRDEKPVDPAAATLFREAGRHFTGTNSHLQTVQSFDKFSRFQPELGRREVWPESVGRVINFTRRRTDKAHPGAVTLEDWADLERSLLRLEASPSMRLVQMAGPPLERCEVGAYNCAYLFMDGPQSLAEDLYCLMQGTGVGFSVEHRHAVDKWPRVKKQRGHSPERYVIPDTTEGWCDALRHGVERWLEGGDYEYDSSQIRKAGTVLRIKGGRASGPQPLLELLNFARGRILARQGERLTSLDIHDITCMAHRIVQMGGVRRASGISLSDLDDPLMRDAKTGTFWNAHPQRNQANDSSVYEEKPSAVEFMEEWLSLAKSGSGERGIFNRGSLKRQLPKRRKTSKHTYGCNPCGEIILRHKQFCNLSIAVLRPDLTVEEVRRRVRLATVWGTVQSTLTRFNYLSDTWRQNCEEERLLGVDLLGHLDCRLTRPGAPGRDDLLALLKRDVLETNSEYAGRLGIPASAAATCIKPSGDSSCFFDTAAGFKAHHGRHYLRRIRLTSDNPVARTLVDAGVPWVEDYDKSGLLVFDFPCRSPEDAILLGDQDEIGQLENWLAFKRHYTEHNPSVTIYVRPDAWLKVGHWVYENWDHVGGLSFLPWDGGVYPLAPYQTISEEEYRQRADSFPEIDWSKLLRYESEDMTTLSREYACTGGACAI